MEAVAAIGLTGNILQFIQYAAQLISTGNEIFESATGSSQRNSELEKIYATLSTFASGLQKHGTSQSGNQSTTSSLPISHSSENLEHFTALNALASDCEEVCGQLLGKIRCLKIEGKKWRACKSFRAALEAAWDGKSISKLESRLDRFQKVILLHFFPIIRYYDIREVCSDAYMLRRRSNQQSSLLGMTIALRKESHDLNLDQSLKLDSISNTLSDLVASNNQLTEELSRNQALVPSIREMSAAENESRVQNNRSLSLKSRVDGLATDISKLALTEHELEDVAKEQAMLRSINFPSRPVRHDNIPLSHEKTFRWMLESGDTEEHSVGERFRDWLSNEDGIFWVSGKPGSGKSTLMKFLADHSTTRVLLEDWSKDLRMVLASHYFWSAGTMMQKSHEGLLRTLLYEIFRLSPVLIRRVCPTRWEQTRTPKTEQLADWTVFELQQTLEAVSQCGDLSSKYCFFIDGIDEFDGDHFELCETLIKLANEYRT